MIGPLVRRLRRRLRPGLAELDLARSPFSPRLEHAEVRTPATVAELVAELPGDRWGVAVDDRPVPRDLWDQVVVEHGSRVVVAARPGAGAAITAAANLGAIISSVHGLPLSKQIYDAHRASDADADDFRSGRRTSPVGDANNARRYEPILQILGQTRVVPDDAITPYTTVEGGKLFGHYLFSLGKGPIVMSDLRIGDDPIFDASTSMVYTGVLEADGDAFNDIEVELRQGTSSDAAITLVSTNVVQTAVEETLLPNRRRIRRTPADVTGFTVIITFPSGLYYRRDSGAVTKATVRVSVEYRLASAAADAAWTAAGNILVRDDTGNSVHAKKVVSGLTAGQYDVRVKRETDASPDPGVVDTCVWSAIVSTIDGELVIEDEVALIAVKAKLTNQLPDGIDDFNLIAYSKIPDYNSGSGLWPEGTSKNPASCFRHVLQGGANLRPAADAEIDLTGLAAWHTVCASEGLTYSKALGRTGRRSVRDVLSEIAAAGRATLTEVDGKIGVTYDQDLTGTPAQHLTPENSWDLRVVRDFPDQVDGLRVQFVNEDEDWLDDERVAPADGFSVSTADDLERFDVPGVTDPEIAYRLARLELKKRAERATLYFVRLDWEYLNLHRGDWVKLAHDALSVGIQSAYIEGLTTDGGGNVTAITVDRECDMVGGGSYGVRIRTKSSSIYRGVSTVAGAQTTLTLSSSIASGSAPAVGDLVTFGDANSETIDCIVEEIRPGDEFGAELVLVDAGDDILSVMDETVPAHTPQVETTNTEAPSAPEITGATSYEPESPTDTDTGITVTLTPMLPTDPTSSSGGNRNNRRRRRRRRQRGR